MADIAGKTPLENAVESGQKEVVKFCIEQGANIPDPVARKRLIREASLSNSWKEIMEELVKEKRFKQQETMLKREVVQIAAANGRHKIIELLIYREKSEGSDDKSTGEEVDTELINHTDEELRTPLLIAAGNGHHNTVKYLLKVEADLEATDKHGKTALFLAAENNHEKVLKTTTPVRADLKEPAIEQLPDNNAQDENREKEVEHEEGDKRTLPERKSLNGYRGQTSERRGMVRKAMTAPLRKKQLIIAGLTEWKTTNCEENTPLHLAAAKGRNFIILKLIEYVGQESTCTNNDESMDEDKQHGGINIEKHEEGQTADGKPIDLPKDVTKYVDAKNDVMNTPLHLAALGGHKHVVKLLIEKGADVKARQD
ncbi:ankyrin repeat domain-containing protein 50-like [Ptychodera flava]|uniref:ankyrin repeat domain-containing protein 50-like n=1 Tax=Ptychodera flava TaxID=63121 RepID=UPI00396A4E88